MTERVLLVRLSAMGDVVQSLGAAEALAAARPDLELHWVVQERFAPLLENLPWLAAVIRHERGAGVRGFVRTARQLRRQGYACALDLQGNAKSALLARASGAGRVVGIRARERREGWSATLLHQRVPAPGLCHPADLALAVVRVLAPGAASRPPRLVARAEEEAAETEVLRGLGVDPLRPFAVAVIGPPDDPRSWPVARAVEFARSGTVPAHLRTALGLPDPGAPWPVVLLAGPDEADARLPEELPALRHGPGGVRRLVALGALLARAHGVAFGPDVGATHVLAGGGARTLALFGPQDPARTAPAAAAVARHADPPPCMPCRRRTCAWHAGPVCMEFGLAQARLVPGWRTPGSAV